MIYIFKGVQSVCSLPGMACKACGECCKSINCNICFEICNNCGKFVTDFFSQPLSTYVIISMIMSAIQLVFSVQVIHIDCDLSKSSAFVSYSPFLFIEIGFAIFNIVFAFFFQRQVWKMIMDLVHEDDHRAKVALVESSKFKQLKQGIRGGSNEEDPEAMPEGRKYLIARETVQAAFRKVFCEDFVVLFYFIVLIAILVISTMARSWLSDAGGECSQASGVPIMGIAFFCVAFVYMFLYSCCACCAASVEISESDLEDMPAEKQ